MPMKMDEPVTPEADTIICVRSGKVQKDIGNGIPSAIHKSVLTGKVRIGDNGIIGDEREYVEHQGFEKALHHYCAAHYPLWRRDKPDRAHMFEIGAFGENFSTQNLNEKNVCIGDVFRIGNDVLVQASEPRTPCFKLNTRFDWPQAARKAQKLNRIGWYWRVLQTGHVQAGDTIALVERPNPRWTIKNVSEVLCTTDCDPDLVVELSKIRELGEPMHDLVVARTRGEAGGLFSKKSLDWLSYQLVDARMVAPRVRQLSFRYKGPADKAPKDLDLGGHAYASIRFGPADKPIERSYSVVSGDFTKFVLGVALDDHSRGGSRYIHEQLRVGDKIEVVHSASMVKAPPPPDPELVKGITHVFIIGGIGVTAFIREVHELDAEGTPFEVHYACRSLKDAAYRDRLPEDETYFYAKDQGNRLDVEKVIPGPDKDGKFRAMIYVCGPDKLMDACEARTTALGYPDQLLHFESFGSGNGGGPLGDPFEVVVDDPDNERKETLQVPEDKSLLDVLVDAGFDVQSNCKAGLCGMCMVSLCGGNVKHKGSALLEHEKKSALLSCVSRGIGKIEIEID